MIKDLFFNTRIEHRKTMTMFITDHQQVMIDKSDIKYKFIQG